MNKIVKRIILVITVISILIIGNVVYGATANISASKISAYVGDNVTINVSINAAAWNLNINGNGITGENITGFNIEGVNQTTTKTYRLNTDIAGTYVIYLKGDISDGATDATTDISKSIAVTVTNKPVVEQPNTNSSVPTKPSNNIANSNVPSPNNNNTSVAKVSSNAYLSQFRIDIPGMTPAFNKGTYNYALTVGMDVNSINITAIPEHNKATVNISGNTNLIEGENIIIVKVTAQDKKTVKIYKIVVTKADDPIRSNAYLQNLIITNATLTPSFTKEVLEYDLGDIPSNIEKLDMSAFPENERAKVDILGNDNLLEGSNEIKIIVTSENEKVQKTYTLRVNRIESNSLLEIEEGNASNNKKLKNNTNSEFNIFWSNFKDNIALILLYMFVWIEFIQVIYLYRKVKLLENREVAYKYHNKEKTNK